MKTNMRTNMRLILGSLLMVGLLAACGGGGFTDEEAEEIREEINDVQAQLDTIEERMTALTAEEDADAESIVNEAQQELEAARDTLASVDERLAPPPQDDPAVAPADPAAPADPGAPAF